MPLASFGSSVLLWPKYPDLENELIGVGPALSSASTGGVVFKRSGWRWLAANSFHVLLAVPVVLLVAVALLRVVLGPGHGVIPLLALAPAVAAIAGDGVYVLAVGGMALGEAALLAFVLEPDEPLDKLLVIFIAIGGVILGGAAGSHIRRRREQELVAVRAVADVTQSVLLRPVPDRVGPLQLTARYLSASTRARIGGDLYAAVPTPYGVRLMVGDAEGKGLSAVQEAATAMGAFRVAAHQESTLSEVLARIEDTLDRELGDEQFITAVLAEVSPDASKVEMINCGHPQPLQLDPRGPQFLGPADGSLPLGLGLPGAAERVSFTVPLRVGGPVLLYTDGLSEARNEAGEFFPLTLCPCLQTPAPLPTLLERLSTAVTSFVGHNPQDDIALVLVQRTAGELESTR